MTLGIFLLVHRKSWSILEYTHLCNSVCEEKLPCIEASDGEIGDVKDFIIDDETWAIRYLIVDTGGWLPGKKVLIAPQWIERVSWEESKVFVNLSRDAIEKSPEFTEELTRDYEAGLYKHYNRQGYWID